MAPLGPCFAAYCDMLTEWVTKERRPLRVQEAGRPILILVGDTDPELNKEQASSLLGSNRNPLSAVHVLANTGHGVLSGGTRDQYRRVVGNFLHGRDGGLR